MELTAVVQYLGDLAHYSITPESNGIYHARLIRYDGPDVVTPPENVILVRGARNYWVGSSAEPHFLDALGQCIEERVRAGDPHSK
ncbi:MAG: hypothetical protein ACO1NX_09390 [Chitinophagaceae bacterium]